MLNMRCEILKKWMVFIILLFPEAAMSANPEESADTIAITVSLLALKALIIAIILALFFRMEFVPYAWMLLVGGVVIYFAVFRPVIAIFGSEIIARAVIIVTDMALIRAISLFSFFRQGDIKEIGWPEIFIAAIVGNIVVYCISSFLGVQ